jgi:N-ethylmaleimide reductase
MVTPTHKKLFTPVQVGAISPKHRVVMPAMSRLRAEWPSGVPSDLMLEYYSQRASEGGLLVTEATAVVASGRGYRGAPGVYGKEQTAGWKRITDAVHARGGYMFVQLWHAGRTTHVAITGEEPVTASVDQAYWADPSILVMTPDGLAQPSPHRALETPEIAGIIEQYRGAALNAKKASFDGVELMAANGHLIDQFLQDNSNKRTDRYGGTIENRARLLFEAVEALIGVWGADHVGVRIAPSGTFNGMADSDPRALFRYVVDRLNDFELAYLHVIEPRIKGGELIAERQGPVAAQELSRVFHGPVIAAGGFEPDTAETTAWLFSIVTSTYR